MSPDALRRIAERRQVVLARMERVSCAGCGASSSVTDALLLGLGHWAECDPTDDDIRFTRRRRAALECSPSS